MNAQCHCVAHQTSEPQKIGGLGPLASEPWNGSLQVRAHFYDGPDQSDTKTFQRKYAMDYVCCKQEIYSRPSAMISHGCH